MADKSPNHVGPIAYRTYQESFRHKSHGRDLWSALLCHASEVCYATRG